MRIDSGRFPAVRWAVLFLLALGGFMAAWAFTQRYNYSLRVKVMVSRMPPSVSVSSETDTV